ncbi:MAG: aldo/keto reductase [Planctomycetota bacterium]|jgi:aryl-alcohol dehydrogenase-like predicted oxidoreductase
MTTKTLGRTGLDVTQLGFGAMELRGPKVWAGREVSDGQSDAVLNAVLDAGINFIDTSPDYGLSEERIGKFISSRRDEYALATKCGCTWTDDGATWDITHIWTRERLMENIAQSLERMRTDHVDILQLHNPDPDSVRDGDIVAVLKDIQSQGLTRFIGISTTLPVLPEFAAMGVFDTFQIPYSCIDPQHHDAINVAADSGAGVIIRGGIGRGGPEGAAAYDGPDGVWDRAKLAELLQGDMTASELILRHTLTHPNCHTTIVGTFDLAHLAANVDAAARGPLPDDLYHEVRRRVADALEA